MTIIGAGLGGIALVANLGLFGYRLRLHDRDEVRIARVRERGQPLTLCRTRFNLPPCK